MNTSHRIFTLSIVLMVAVLALATVLVFRDLIYPFEIIRWSVYTINPLLIDDIIWYTLPYASIPLVVAVVGSLIAYFASVKADQNQTFRFLLFWCVINAVTGFLVIAYVGSIWLHPASISEISNELLFEGWLIFLLLCYAVGSSTILGMICLIGFAQVFTRRVANSQT